MAKAEKATPTPIRQKGRSTRLRLAGVVLLVAAGSLVLAFTAFDTAEERARGHYESGLELVAEDSPIKAMLEFRNAIRLDPEFGKAYFELGRVLQGEGNLTGAVANYKQAINNDETLLDAYLRLGRIMLAADQLDEALSASITAFQIAPDNVDVLVLKASTALRLENIDSAKQTVADALALDPDNGDVWLVKSAITREEGNFATALEQIDYGISRNPDNVQMILFKLDLLSRLDRRDEITATIELLVANNPETVAFRQSQVRWQLSQGQYDVAEANLRKIAALRPGEPQFQIDVVKLVLRTRGTAAAAAELDRLIETTTDVSERFDYQIARVDLDISERKMESAMDRLAQVIEDVRSEAVLADRARLQLARINLSRQNREGGEALIEEVLETDSRNPDALALRAQLQIQDDDYEAAVRTLRTALKESPDHIESLELLSVAYERNGSRQLSGERLAAAVSVSDYAARPTAMYTRHLVREGKTAFAETVLLEALRRDGRNRTLLTLLAEVRMQLQDYVGAEQIGKMLSEMDSETGIGEQITAAALSGQERFDESLDILRNLGNSDSGRSSPMAEIVLTYLRADRMDDAKAFVIKTLEQNSNNPEALRLRGAIAMLEQDQKLAEIYYKQAIAATPAVAEGFAALAQLYYQTARASEAEDVLRKGIALTDNAGLRLNLALVLEQRGALKEAIAEYEIIYRTNSSSELVANNLASLIADSNPTPEGIERATAIAKRLKESTVPHFQDTYGWLLHLSGDHRQAVGILETAAKGLPDNPVVRYHFGVALMEVGETERAIAELEAALELGKDAVLPQMELARAALDSLKSSSSSQ